MLKRLITVNGKNAMETDIFKINKKKKERKKDDQSYKQCICRRI